MSIIQLLFYVPLAMLAVEAATELIVKSEIFKPLVERVKGSNYFAAKMLSCGYCTSVWLAIPPAIFFALLTSPILIVFWVLALHRGANYLHNINDKFFDKYYDPRFKG